MVEGLGACPGPPPLRARPSGGLVILCKPKSAQIFVDDRYQGTVGAVAGRSLPLAVGVHRIELRKDGYFGVYREVTVVRGVRQTISVILRKEPF
ncbi:MAG: PEGA domain-containing protein [Deltaproteobacteria bacterium]|nr:PEGA domain-containing protein [Deltaproteobacteria bacterium]